MPTELELKKKMKPRKPFVKSLIKKKNNKLKQV